MDGTLIRAWASHASFVRKDGGDGDDAGDGANFHGQVRGNQTHVSTTDPDARLFKKSQGSEAHLSYLGHALTENRHTFVVAATVTQATGTAEREAALVLMDQPAPQGAGRPADAWVRGPQGLHLHSTLAFTGQGTPLGFLDVQCWARDREDFGKKAKRHRLPIEEKESFKWLKSYRAVAAVQARLPKTTLVSVGDREADLYELFRQAAEHPQGPKLLIRAEHNRQLQDEQARLWETLQEKPVSPSTWWWPGGSIT